MIFRFLVMATVALVISLNFGCSNSNPDYTSNSDYDSDSNSIISLVTDSNFDGYPTLTIGEILNNNLDNPKWTIETSDRGETVVVFRGQITNKSHDMVMNGIKNFIETYGGKVLVLANPEFNDSYTIIDNYYKCINELQEFHLNALKDPNSDYNKKYRDLVAQQDALEKQNYRYDDKIIRQIHDALSEFDHIKSIDDRFLFAFSSKDLKNYDEDHEMIYNKFFKQCDKYRNEYNNGIHKFIEALDSSIWVPGDIVTIEFLIYSNNDDFKLRAYGAKTIYDIQTKKGIQFNSFLKVIFN